LNQVPESEMTLYYVKKLLPRKVALDLDYASRATFSSDLKLLVQTAIAILP